MSQVEIPKMDTLQMRSDHEEGLCLHCALSHSRSYESGGRCPKLFSRDLIHHPISLVKTLLKQHAKEDRNRRKEYDLAQYVG